MKKLGFLSIFIIIISFTLTACSEDSNADNANANKNDAKNNEEVNEDEDENANNEEEKEDVNEENNGELNEEENDKNNDAEAEEESLADAISVLDVDKVLLDQEEEDVSRFKNDEAVFIKHDELMYVEHNFITKLLDYELTYDEENTFAEIFEKKGDFKYKPSHKDGAIMDIGQIYVEDSDEYEDIPGDSAPLYKFIEYEGRLYVPERLINVHMKAPINYERRDKTIEVGLHAEAKTLDDVGIDNESSSRAEVTQDASDVTIEGKNYSGGIIIRNVNSASKRAAIHTDYNYSEISGFIYNRDDETIEITFRYNDDVSLETIELEPGETDEFEYDLKGEEFFYIEAKGEPGSSSEVVIIGEIK